MTFGCCCFDQRLANSRAGWRGLARSRPVMKAALAHHLVAPVEPPANEHKSNGERCDAEDYIQRHDVASTVGILIFTVIALLERVPVYAGARPPPVMTIARFMPPIALCCLVGRRC